MIAFDAASFCETGNLAENIPRSFDVAFVSALSKCCINSFFVLTGCVDESNNGLGRAGHKGLSVFGFVFFLTAFFEACDLS